MKTGSLWLSQPPVAQPAGLPPSFAMIGLVFSGAPAEAQPFLMRAEDLLVSHGLASIL
jgi:hypothetical protein